MDEVVLSLVFINAIAWVVVGFMVAAVFDIWMPRKTRSFCKSALRNLVS